MTLKKTDPEKAIVEICSCIKRNNTFLVLTHEKPDGDAIGSQLAMLIALRKMGKTAEGITEVAPEQYQGLPQFAILTSAEEYKMSVRPDVCIVLDSSNFARTPVDVLPEGICVINIDHHGDNALFGELNYVDQNAAATGILIYKLLSRLGVEFDEEIAENLFAAIITDTGRFGFTNTNAEVFDVMAGLVRHGASPVEMTNKLYKNYSYRRAVVFSKVLNSLESHINGKVVTMELPFAVVREMGIEQHETDGLVEYLQGIKEQEAAFLLKEFLPGKIRVSLRSRGKINVMMIAEKHDGGGHFAASGCTMKMPLEEAKKVLVEECRLQMD
jgi:phosphoesterase RecJ-like protein